MPTTKDTGAPKLRVFPIPSNPTTGQKVTFVAQASDPGGIARVEILVNARKAKTCTDSVCKYVGGPYPEGTVSYGANAYDKAGNRTWTGYQALTIEAADTTPPLLRVYHRPAHPTTGQRVTFMAQARDPGGVTKIEILVNARIVKTCTADSCSYVGGPFPKGTVTYGANAYDRAGNRAWTGYKSFVVVEPEPVGRSTISGQLTGQRHLVKKVGAYSLDQPGLQFTVSAHASGRFRLSDLPDGRYRVYPVPPGKVEVISEPMHHDVRCRGGQSYTVNFEIKGIMEG